MALGWFSPFISDSRFTILFGKAGSCPMSAIATRPPKSRQSAFLSNPDIPEFDWLWERSREDRQSRDLIVTKGYVRAQPL